MRFLRRLLSPAPTPEEREREEHEQRDRARAAAIRKREADNEAKVVASRAIEAAHARARARAAEESAVEIAKECEAVGFYWPRPSMSSRGLNPKLTLSDKLRAVVEAFRNG